MEAGEDDTYEPSFFKAEEYEVRSGTISQGHDYEYKTVALVSLRCVLQFHDFDIAFNADSVGAFDDVVVIAKKKNEDGNMGKIKIMMQLKHKENEDPLATANFLTTNPKRAEFSLSKYYEDIVRLKQRLQSQSAVATKILHHLEVVDNNTYFVLFTNKQTREQEFFKDCSFDNISFLNTNSDENSKNFYTIDLSKVSSLSNPDCNINFSFFAKQSNATNLNKLIEAELETVLKQFGLTDVINIENISEQFLKYITIWAMGKLGGHYFLRKDDVLYKLTELLLSQHELILNEEELDFGTCPQTCLWHDVLKDKAITVVDSNDKVVVFLKLYIQSEVTRYCQDKKKWYYKLSPNEKSSFYSQHAELKKAMLKVVGNFGTITALNIYKCLWFSQRLPLLLKVKIVQDYNAILKILKICNFSLKVIIINETKSTLNTEEVASLCFATLSDLSDQNRRNILNYSVKLQGRSSVELGELVDNSLFGHISCNTIIDILLGNYNIGIEFEPLPTYFIHRCLLKVFLKMDVLEQVNNEIFLIEIHEESEEIRNKIMSGCKADNVIKFNKNDPTQIEKLKSERKPIHLLIFHNNKLLEWKESFGSTSNIIKYQIRHRNNFTEYIGEMGGSHENSSWLCDEVEDILISSNNANNLFKSIRLVGASPGMGKSQLLNYITSKASTDMWVLNVKLKDHYEHYQETKSTKESLSASYHLNYVNGTHNNQLAKAVFQKFVNKKKVLVNLDGFDEVPISCKNEALKIIKCIHQAGFPIWLTTRPHLVTYLEEKLGTIATTLKPFSIGDQKNFFYKYFLLGDEISSDGQDNQILIEKLLQSVGQNLNDSYGEFLGIPLHTKMIADAFSGELKKSFSEGIIQFELKFDLPRLYEKFIEAKDVILRKTLGLAAMNVKEQFRKLQQLFALKLLFPNHHLVKLDVEGKMEEFTKNNKDYIQNLQQDGLTVIEQNVSWGKGQNFQVNFVHRTYAEYMAACWLIENFNSECDSSRWTAKVLIHMEFDRCKTNSFLFKMFNLILAKGCPLLNLIINGRLEEAQKLVASNPDCLDETDLGGRSFLHMVGLYGGQNRFALTNFLQQIPVSKLTNMTDTFGCTPLDYALLSRSYRVAYQLYKESKQTLVTSMLHNRELEDIAELELFLILFPFFVCQQLLEESSYNQQFSDYCSVLFHKLNFRYLNRREKEIKLIIEHNSNKTLDEFLAELKIKSATEPYYYDLRFAAAFGTLLNVLDLIESEYAIGDEQNFNYCSPLCSAIKHNRLEIVKILLYYGEKVDEPCMHENYHSPLHCAAEEGYIDIVEELLLCKADVNIQDVCGNTPLSLALRRRNVDIAKLLLSNGANANLRNSFGYFPIRYAVENGCSDIIPDLSKGVEINYQDFNGNTLLHIALLNRHLDTVQLLLRYGADYKLRNNYGEFPVHMAAKAGFHQVLPDILPENCDLNVINNEGLSLLHLLVDRGHLSSADRLITIKFLLSNGSNVNHQDRDGNTVLHYLCKVSALDKSDRKKVVEFLLDNGADINLKNRSNITPLHEFILNNANNLSHIDAFLHNNTADVNIPDLNGNTALHYLCRQCPVDKEDRNSTARLLLDKGADVNLKNEYNRTPLHEFIINNPDNLSDIGTFLHNNRADVNLPDRNGNTALHYLCRQRPVDKKDRNSAARLLLDKGAVVNLKNEYNRTPLHEFMIYNTDNLSDIGTFLHNNRADVNLPDHYGNTALHYLCRRCPVDKEDRNSAARLLLDKGADVNKQNKYGRTPIHVFIPHNSSDLPNICSLLYNNRADLNIPDLHGNTALHYLCCNNEINTEPRKNSLKLFFDHGADINKKNKNGKTPLHLAMKCIAGDLSQIVPLLLRNGTDVNIQDIDGNTALHYLFYNFHMDTEDKKQVVNLLLDEGADLNLKNAEGLTVADHPQFSEIKQLLENRTQL